MLPPTTAETPQMHIFEYFNASNKRPGLHLIYQTLVLVLIWLGAYLRGCLFLFILKVNNDYEILEFSVHMVRMIHYCSKVLFIKQTTSLSFTYISYFWYKFCVIKFQVSAHFRGLKVSSHWKGHFIWKILFLGCALFRWGAKSKGALNRGITLSLLINRFPLGTSNACRAWCSEHSDAEQSILNQRNSPHCTFTIFWRLGWYVCTFFLTHKYLQTINYSKYLQ